MFCVNVSIQPLLHSVAHYYNASLWVGHHQKCPFPWEILKTRLWPRSQCILVGPEEGTMYYNMVPSSGPTRSLSQTACRSVQQLTVEYPVLQWAANPVQTVPFTETAPRCICIEMLLYKVNSVFVLELMFCS